MTPWIADEASSTRRACTSRGRPPSARNCFGTVPPIRRPRPAAGTRATVRLTTRDLKLLPLALFFESCEDHAPRCRLEDAGDHDVHIPADAALRVVHDDHGSIVQVGDPLPGFLAFLEHEHADGLTGQHDRTQRVA